MTMNDNRKVSKGYVQLYTGSGKGKTTAALGLALRASGHGFCSYIAQFMKKYPYGELAAVDNFPLITIEQFGTGKHADRDRISELDKEKAREGLKFSEVAMLSDEYDIVVLDEVNLSIWFGILEVGEVIDFLDKKPKHAEVILTGRFAPEALIRRADLVTEMREVKHYYSQLGVETRLGIER